MKKVPKGGLEARGSARNGDGFVWRARLRPPGPPPPRAECGSHQGRASRRGGELAPRQHPWPVGSASWRRVRMLVPRDRARAFLQWNAMKVHRVLLLSMPGFSRSHGESIRRAGWRCGPRKRQRQSAFCVRAPCTADVVPSRTGQPRREHTPCLSPVSSVFLVTFRPVVGMVCPAGEMLMRLRARPHVGPRRPGWP